jgi:hypothetical protein
MLSFRIKNHLGVKQGILLLERKEAIFYCFQNRQCSHLKAIKDILTKKKKKEKREKEKEDTLLQS